VLRGSYDLIHQGIICCTPTEQKTSLSKETKKRKIHMKMKMKMEMPLQGQLLLCDH